MIPDHEYTITIYVQTTNMQSSVILHLHLRLYQTILLLTTVGQYMMEEGLRDNYISGNKQVGPNVTELGIGTQSDQFYSVEEVFDPRSTPVSDAGLPRDKF